MTNSNAYLGAYFLRGPALVNENFVFVAVSDASDSDASDGDAPDVGVPDADGDDDSDDDTMAIDAAVAPDVNVEEDVRAAKRAKQERKQKQKKNKTKKKKARFAVDEFAASAHAGTCAAQSGCKSPISPAHSRLSLSLSSTAPHTSLVFVLRTCSDKPQALG